MKLPLNVLLTLIWNSWPKGAKYVIQNLDGTLEIGYPSRNITTKQKYPLSRNPESQVFYKDYLKANKLQLSGLNFTYAIRDLNAGEKAQEEMTNKHLAYCHTNDACLDMEPEFDYEDCTKLELAKEIAYRDAIMQVLISRISAQQAKNKPKLQPKNVEPEITIENGRSYDSLAQLVGCEFRLYPAATELPWPFWVRQTPEGYIECMFSENFSIPAESLNLRETWHEVNFAFTQAEVPEQIHIVKPRKTRKYTLAPGAVVDGKSAVYIPSTKLIELYKEHHSDNNANAPIPLHRNLNEVKLHQEKLDSSVVQL
ncbi:hypothetical protein [Vibrio phage vB_VibM_83AMN]|nr:hypothetical protein [Vibrio phage vB_VibM_83AMN]